MFSSLVRFHASSQLGLWAIRRVVDSRRVSTIFRLCAARVEPVSVPSTMASTRSGTFTSVAPQVAGDAGIEHAGMDVAGDLLGAEQDWLKLGVVDHRLIGARRRAEVPARALEEIKGGLLQTAFGETDSELVHLREILTCGGGHGVMV